MEYGSLERGAVQEYAGGRFNKNPSMLCLYVITAAAAFGSFFLGFYEWEYMDVKGECDVINSGREYYSRWGCENAELKSSCNASTFKEMVKRRCHLQDDPYYGQCVSPVLSISAGAAGMLVALLVAAPCCTCGGTIQTMASFVASSAFVLGAATFITSFYAFDHNLKDDSFLKDINCLLCYVFSRSTFRQISKSAANTTTRLRLLIIRR